MKIARSLAVLAASAVILGLTTLDAASASKLALSAPPNDSINSATRLGAPPAKYVEDTSKATHNSTDGKCVGGSSVWFRSRSAVTRTVRLSTVGSDYSTTLAVFSGPKSNRTLIGCASGFLDEGSFGFAARQVRFVAGKTYWVAVSACCGRGATGGQLVLNTWRPTAAGISATIESVETGTVSGELLVTGTVRCKTPSAYEVQVSASERVADGANVASGGGYVDDVCGPTSKSWSLVIDSNTGWAFQPGTARLTQAAFVYDGFGFEQAGPEANNFDVTANPNARSSHTVS